MLRKCIKTELENKTPNKTRVQSQRVAARVFTKMIQERIAIKRHDENASSKWVQSQFQ